MASVAPRRSGANATRRGSAFVSPVVSSDSDTSDEERETYDSPPRRQSRWSRESSSSSSSESSEAFSVDEDDVQGLEASTDAYEDFVGRRGSPQQRKRSSQTSSQSSNAKLARLRRIFLNMPAKSPKSPRKEKERLRQHHTSTKRVKSLSSSSIEGTNSNSSGDEKEGETVGSSVGQTPPLTLPIDHHVKTLSEQVKRLARTHDAHAQQWHAMLTQAIAELQFVKQQEERALQSHVQLLQESYALRLEVFEQQYRAKVAEIRDQMQQEIAQHRQRSDLAIVTTAQRLQEQAQQVLLQTDGCGNQEPCERGLKVNDEPAMTLVKTTQFLQRQQQREDARRSRLQSAVDSNNDPPATDPVLSPVSKQRAKLKLLEQKLASFPRETVERVTRTMDNQYREQQSRGELPTVLTATHSAQSLRSSGLQPTPLSPLRKRASYWHNGISREASGDRQAEMETSRPPHRPTSALSRRFLRPEEEKELRMLRNSIGLAKDWMEQHNNHARG